jgi:hypothetical protein
MSGTAPFPWLGLLAGGVNKVRRYSHYLTQPAVDTNNVSPVFLVASGRANMTNEDRERKFDISDLKTAPTRAQAVEYIHKILGDLIPMAKSAELPPVVGHLLEMASLETESLLKRRTPRRE